MPAPSLEETEERIDCAHCDLRIYATWRHHGSNLESCYGGLDTFATPAVRTALSPSTGEMPELDFSCSTTRMMAERDVEQYSDDLLRGLATGLTEKLMLRERQLRAANAEVGRLKVELAEADARLELLKKVDPDWHEMQATEADAIGEEFLLPCVAHHDAQRDLLRAYIKGDAKIVLNSDTTAHASGKLEGRKEALKAVKDIQLCEHDSALKNFDKLFSYTEASYSQAYSVSLRDAEQAILALPEAK